jgi:hypothetical protein
MNSYNAWNLVCMLFSKRHDGSHTQNSDLNGNGLRCQRCTVPGLWTNAQRCTVPGLWTPARNVLMPHEVRRRTLRSSLSRFSARFCSSVNFWFKPSMACRKFAILQIFWLFSMESLSILQASQIACRNRSKIVQLQLSIY